MTRRRSARMSSPASGSSARRSSARRTRGCCEATAATSPTSSSMGCSAAAVCAARTRTRIKSARRLGARAPIRASRAVLTAADLPDLPPLPCIDAEETTHAVQPADDRARTRSATSASRSPSSWPSDRYVAEDVAGPDRDRLRAAPGGRRRREGDGPTARRSSTRRRTSCDTLKYELGDAGRRLRSRRRTSSRSASRRSATHGCRWRCRGAIADWDPRNRASPLTSSTQVPNAVKRDVCRPASACPESGVGCWCRTSAARFGVKIQTYPEEILLCFLARRLGRPVKWIEDRWEHIVSATHGREQFHDVEVAYDDDGPHPRHPRPLRHQHRRLPAAADAGRAVHRRGDAAPARTTSPTSRRPRDVVMTNKAPMNPFRGVGHVQAAFTMERIMDTIARDLGLDPAEVRLRNLIPADELPRPRGLGNVLAGEIIYDSRRLRRVPATSPRDVRLRGVPRRAGASSGGEGRPARHRHRLLRRGDRARPVRDGRRSASSRPGQVVVLHRRVHQRPGPPDHARADRRRHARASTWTTSTFATATPTSCAGESAPTRAARPRRRHGHAQRRGRRPRQGARRSRRRCSRPTPRTSS